MDIQRAINHLTEHELLSLPHGLTPGAKAGGHETAFTEESWFLYDWMQVGGAFGVLEVDSRASNKPTWRELEEADEQAEIAELKGQLLTIVKQQVRKRINRAYGAESDSDEIYMRMRQEHTPEQDTERERLRQIYARQKELIETSTLPELREYDCASDLVWATIPTTPMSPVLEAGDRKVHLATKVDYDGGCPITRWEYRYAAGKGAVERAQWLRAPVNEVTRELLVVLIDALVNDRAYWFQTRAINAVGPSLASPKESATPSAA